MTDIYAVIFLAMAGALLNIAFTLAALAKPPRKPPDAPWTKDDLQ